MKVTSRHLATELNRLFGRYLLSRQKRELLRDAAQSSRQERDTVMHCRSVCELDDRFPSKPFGFDNAIEFYRRHSAIHFMTEIQTPTLLIQGRDDPVIHRSFFDQVDWRANWNLSPAMVRSGGHAGCLTRDGRRSREMAGVAPSDEMGR